MEIIGLSSDNKTIYNGYSSIHIYYTGDPRVSVLFFAGFQDHRTGVPDPDRKKSRILNSDLKFPSGLSLSGNMRARSLQVTMIPAGTENGLRDRSERFFDDHPKDEYTVRVRIPRTDTR